MGVMEILSEVDGVVRLHDVDGGDPVAQRVFEREAGWVEGVGDVEEGLDRQALIGAVQASPRLRIDEAGHDNLAGEIDFHRVKRDGEVGSDGRDDTVLDENVALRDLFADDRDDSCSRERDPGGWLLRQRARGCQSDRHRELPRRPPPATFTPHQCALLNHGSIP
jgi:hypothetical protein